MLTKKNKEKMLGNTSVERKVASNADEERLKELRELLESIKDPGDRPSIEAEIFQLEEILYG
tara:strand:- start:2486 stop:2671 length:186 start_codon:yes stop_codon:yes gene_type:complete